MIHKKSLGQDSSIGNVSVWGAEVLAVLTPVLVITSMIWINLNCAHLCIVCTLRLGNPGIHPS